MGGMKKMLLLTALTVGIGCLAGMFIMRYQAAQEAASLAKAQAISAAPPVVVPPPPQPEPVLAPELAPQEEMVPPEPAPEPAPKSARAPRPVRLPTTPIQPQGPDQTAREALSYVGADPQANEYWIGAINNPNLPARERQNLIEDLNEDGLSDPQNPSMDDLPLIQSRLELIDELAADAMDQVNADAFAEARKDLVEMYYNLTGDSW
jgi:hypothetical protein